MIEAPQKWRYTEGVIMTLIPLHSKETAPEFPVLHTHYNAMEEVAQ